MSIFETTTYVAGKWGSRFDNYPQANVDAALEQQILNVAQRKGNRTYIITTRRITAGDELKRRKSGIGGSALDLRLIPIR